MSVSSAFILSSAVAECNTATPDSLIARTPTPPEVGTSTMLQVPSRPAPFERSPSIGIEGRKFFAGEQSAFEGLESEQMKEVMVSHIRDFSTSTVLGAKII